MNTLLSQNWVECLGWTLVHFIWQGFVIAALLAIVLRLMRGAASNQRYLAGCLALVLMAIAPAITLRVVVGRFAAEPAPAAASFETPSAEAGTLLNPSSSSRFVVTATRSRHSRNVAEKVERFFPWMVLGWSLGVLALSCRLLGGWLQVERLRRHGVSALTEDWHQKMKLLSERLGIHRPVRLLQSALVEVPTAIGWLRPMILLPASCIVGLSPAQLESILAHELAHIRRHDYLVNLLQSVVETVLFYHPAVWWVSRRVREERENCCDDLAVEVSGDRAVYARALATLETLRPASAPLALGASGSPLLPRIRRLAGQSPTNADRSAWPIAGIVVLILTAMLAVELRGNRVLAQENNATNAPPRIGMRLNTIVKAGNPPKMAAKLNSIEVDSIQFDHLPMRQVIWQVLQLSKSLDPDHTGINFVLESSYQSPTNSAKIDPATGLPEKVVRVDMEDVKVTIDPPLYHMRMADVLDAIVRGADHPLRYRVSDYGVVFSPKQPGALETRTFHVDPNTFRQGLQGTIGKSVGNPAGSTNGSPSASAAPTQSSSNAVVAQMQAQVRRFFEQAGVDLSTNNPANEGKMFVWNDRKGILLVRASTDDLDKVDAAIQKMNYVLLTNANKIYIAAKNPLGSPHVSAPSPTSGVKGKDAPATPQTRFTPEVDIKVKFLELDVTGNKNAGFTLQGQDSQAQALINYPPNLTHALPASVTNIIQTDPGFRVTNSMISSGTGIMTKQQFQKAVDALEKLDGVDELNAPEVTTESGRQAQVQAVDLTTLVTGVDSMRDDKGNIQPKIKTQTLPLGPVVDLMPRVSPDHQKIDLTAIATVTEFLGYGDPRHPVKNPEKLKLSPNGMPPLPNIRVRQMTTHNSVHDGDTLVLFGLESERVNVMTDKVPLLGSVPFVGRLFRTTSTTKTQKELMVFITPTMINPDGTPVHTEKVASDEKHPTSL